MSHMRSSHNYLILLLVSSASAFTLLAQQPAPATNTSAPQPTPTLLIQTDLDCTFTVDDGASVALLADVIKKMPIALGEHLITAVTADRKDQWKTVVNADKPVQKVVVIELQKVRAAREKGEREAAQLEQDIKTKKEQAEKDGGETRDKATLQNAIKQRQTEIEGQIVELRRQVRLEVVAAQADDDSAQQSRVNQAIASTQRTNIGMLAGIADNALATSSASSATAHRVRAAQLQSQIDDLNRQAASLDSGGPLLPMGAGEKIGTIGKIPGEDGVFNLGHGDFWGHHPGQLSVSPDRVQWVESGKPKHNLSLSCAQLEQAVYESGGSYVFLHIKGVGERDFDIQAPYTAAQVVDALSKACPSLERLRLVP